MFEVSRGDRKPGAVLWGEEMDIERYGFAKTWVSKSQGFKKTWVCEKRYEKIGDLKENVHESAQ